MSGPGFETGHELFLEFDVLGLNFMIRAEYIKQLKLLIKKYHPDLCYDERLKQKYTEITIRLNEKLTRLVHGPAPYETPPNAGPPVPGEAGAADRGPRSAAFGFDMPKPGEPGYVFYYAPFQAAPPAKETKALKTLKDQGYAWYRQGIQYWRRIHPGRFYKKVFVKHSKSRFPEHMDISSREEAEVIKDIFFSFKRARYFFTRVLEDYADSPWVFDATRKLKFMEKLELIYKQWIQKDLEEQKKNFC
jgi:hypothetical protein